MTKRDNIYFLTNNMTAGGAERMMSNIVNHLSSEEPSSFEIGLITTASTEDFYSISSKVKRKSLDSKTQELPSIFKYFRFLLRLWNLRSIIKAESPKVMISFLENVNVLNVLACLGTSTKSVVCMRNDPRKSNIGIVLSLMRKALYPFANQLIVQTQSVKDWVKEQNLNSNTLIIPNFVNIPEHEWANSFHGDRSFRFLAVGRLVYQKGFDLLIGSASLLKKKGLSFTLDIYGQGPLKEDLESKIKKEGLADIIKLKGLTANLEEELLSCDAFVLSSRYEGFPNVLLEAMALGVPCVAFDCKSGPREIISDDTFGILVEDGNVEKLAEGMESLVNNPELRCIVGKSGRESMSRFEKSAIIGKWKSLFI